MADLTLTLACWDYDRVKPLLDGRVRIPGCAIVPVVLKSEQTFPRVFQRQEFDVSELSVSSYFLQLSRGEASYVAIPAFVSRAFRHGAIYVRTDRGIADPKDLEGRTVGVPEYQMTLALWLRGILQDEYGVDFRTLRYRTGGTNIAGRKERLPLRLPPEMDVRPVEEGRSLNDLLVAGELDAVMSPTPPDAFTEGHPKVRRLIADPAAAERAYHRKTGFFPIMHLVGLRRTLAERYPWLAARLFAGFVAAKALAMAEMTEIAAASASKLSLPWFADELAATRALMGEDFWRYGVAENRRELETLCRWSAEQHLAGRRLDVAELFAAETLDMSGL